MEVKYVYTENGEKEAVILSINFWNKIKNKLGLAIKKETKSSPREIEKNISRGKSNKKKIFFEFVKQHSFNIPEGYKFNRDELYE